MTAQTHDERGKFAKGNTLGMKHGGKTRERLLRALTPEQMDQLLADEYEAAAKGDIASRQFLLARWVAPLRPTLEKSKFQMNTDSLEEAAKSILVAISDGTIAADIGESLMRSLNVAGNLGQLSAMSQRLVALEERLTSRNGSRDVTPMAAMITDAEMPDAPSEAALDDVDEPTWREHATIIADED